MKIALYLFGVFVSLLVKELLLGNLRNLIGNKRTELNQWLF